MTPKALISIIVVNYNSSTEIIDLVKSLKKCTHHPYELIVVDNASPNDDLTLMMDLFPEINLIQSSKNLGFAGGNNLGMQHAKGQYYLFLNPDTVVTMGFLEPMLELLERHPDIGLVSPKIKYFHTPSLIQYAGSSEMSLFTMRNTAWSKHQKDSLENAVSKPTGYGHGAAMMVPKNVALQTGGMRESYFLYYEELDWCERIKNAGYKIYYVASSLIYHKESVSVEKQSPLKIFYLSRNRMLFARLHYQTWQLILYILFTAFVVTPKTVFQYWTQPTLLKAYFRGVSWHLYS